jgi:HEAT repeat protein
MTVLFWILGFIVALWIYAKIHRALKRRAQQRSAMQKKAQARTNTLTNVNSPDPGIRENAISRLQKESDSQLLVRIAGNDPIASVRLAACKRLRTWNETEVTCDLIRQCARAGQSVQIGEALGEWRGHAKESVIFDLGIRCLIQMGTGEALKELMNFYGLSYGKRTPEELKQQNGEMLAAFRQQPEVATLRAMEFLSAQPGRIHVLKLLGALKQKSAIPFLRRLSESEQPGHIVDEALKSLVEIGGTDSAAAVAAALDHKEPRVRRAACECLGNMHETAPMSLIAPALLDADESVRLTAIRSLSRYGQQCVSALNVLVRRESSANVKFEAAAVLCEKGDATSRDELFNELLRQATLERVTCSQPAIQRACAYFSCSEEYALARTALHIPMTQRVCGHSSSGGGEYYADELQPDASLEALRELCPKRSSFSTEILKLIAARQSVTVQLSSCNVHVSDRTVDLSQWQQEARQELIRRGIRA